MTNNPITPESLIEDNKSPYVEKYLERWQDNFYEQNFFAVVSCSDPRLMVPRDGIIDIRSIGAAALPELYDSVLNENFNPQAIIVVVHHDGQTVKNGQMPLGCGGLGVKAMQEHHEEEHEHERQGYSAGYVDKFIIHSDPFIHGMYTGHEIAERSRRPTLVATEDHRTGILYPLTSFIPYGKRDMIVRSAIPMRYGFEGRYNPEEIYHTGLPHLEAEQVPNEFNVFIRRHNIFLEKVKEMNPNMYENQKIINPLVVALTTEIRSIRARFPTLFGTNPNTVFAVTVPRNTHESRESYDLDVEGMKRAFDQTHYAFARAIQHKGDPERSFSRLYNQGTLLIEGDNLEQLNEVADYALELPYIRDWSNVEGNKIILMETNKGRLLKARQLNS
jgi:hypothetical protein